MMHRALFNFVIVLATALAALGSGAGTTLAQSTDGHCDGAGFGDDLGLARIARGQAKVNFVRGVHSAKSCPSASPECRDKPFLMAGDVVLTSGAKAGFVCSTFVNSRAIETIGWLPNTALETIGSAPIPSAGWLGTWKRIEAQIAIKPAAGGKLALEGTAVWGSYDKGRVARGAVQNGEFSGTVAPAGDVVFLSDEPAPSFEKVPESVCAVRMRRIGPYLIVEDNRACGGMNVSFSGIYVRR